MTSRRASAAAHRHCGATFCNAARVVGHLNSLVNQVQVRNGPLCMLWQPCEAAITASCSAPREARNASLARDIESTIPHSVLATLRWRRVQTYSKLPLYGVELCKLCAVKFAMSMDDSIRFYWTGVDPTSMWFELLDRIQGLLAHRRCIWGC